MVGAHDLSPGSRFRGLLVHGVLGRGAFGSAHLASHSVLKTPFVVKRYAGEAEDLFREAHLAARVRSPHVVDVVDAGWEDGAAFLVQRYVDGIDLGELSRAALRDGVPVPAAMAARIISGVAIGLHAIHQAGVVHRDVKPPNLFLAGDGHAQVGDFGVAQDPTTRVRDGKVVGTPLYVAPELWQGDEPTARSDIYALGATAHVLLTGVPPFVAPTIPEVARAHIEQPYEAPPGRDPVDAYVGAAIAAMLAKSPRDRPASARDVAELLGRIACKGSGVSVTGLAEARMSGVTVRLRHGDLASCEADVLVSAANRRLAMDVGVAQALSDAAGPALAQEASVHAPVAMGDVVFTGAHGLSAEWVAHAVAAMSGAVCIQRATLRALLGARERGATRVAFPALGTGVGQVPHALAATLLLGAVATFARIGAGSVREVEVALLDAEVFDIWSRSLRAL